MHDASLADDATILASVVILARVGLQLRMRIPTIARLLDRALASRPAAPEVVAERP
jgi:hypothetical protein